jgi:hypothetical protein
MGNALLLFFKLLWKKILELLSETYDLSKYIFNFVFMVMIAWGVSLFTPLDTFQAGILLMIFWFLNLYHRTK